MCSLRDKGNNSIYETITETRNQEHLLKKSKNQLRVLRKKNVIIKIKN